MATKCAPRHFPSTCECGVPFPQRGEALVEIVAEAAEDCH